MPYHSIPVRKNKEMNQCIRVMAFQQKMYRRLRSLEHSHLACGPIFPYQQLGVAIDEAEV
jgi:hypothetical protein